MARGRDAKFFECPDCNKFTLLGNITGADTCPGCGSPNGRIISSSELEKRVEAGAVVNIDLSPGGRDKPKRP